MKTKQKNLFAFFKKPATDEKKDKQDPVETPKTVKNTTDTEGKKKASAVSKRGRETENKVGDVVEKKVQQAKADKPIKWLNLVDRGASKEKTENGRKNDTGAAEGGEEDVSMVDCEEEPPQLRTPVHGRATKKAKLSTPPEAKKAKSAKSKERAREKERKLQEARKANSLPVGTRLRVYWPQDNDWFLGTVSSSGVKVRVDYDDGDMELLDLRKEKYEILEKPDEKSQEEGNDTEMAETSTTSDPSKRKRRIIESEDEEEDDASVIGTEKENDQKVTNVLAEKQAEARGSEKEEDEADLSTPGRRVTRGRASKRRTLRKLRKMVEDSSEEESAPSGIESSDDAYKTSDESEQAESEDDEDLEEEEDSDAERQAPKISKRKSSTQRGAPQRPSLHESNKNWGKVLSPHSKNKSNGSQPSPFSAARFTSSQNSRSNETPSRQRKSLSGLSSPSAGRSPSPFPASSPLPRSPGPGSPAPSQNSSGNCMENGVYPLGQHLHDELSWLQQRRDKQGRKEGEEGFNTRTLKIPQDYLKSETPAMQQWWEFKSENMDTVLFFKVGKFYELFHMDADVGVQELDLFFMKGKKAHCGFPEIAYGKFSSILVHRGYRVGRIEQTQTPEELKRSNQDRKKKKKVVERELCSIISRGTRMGTVMEINPDNPGEPLSHTSSLLLSLKESFLNPRETPRTPPEDAHRMDLSPSETEGGDKSEQRSKRKDRHCVSYGFCLTDCSTGSVQLGEFQDTSDRGRLQMFLAHVRPAEVVYEEGALSSQAISVVQYFSPSALFIALRPGEDWWGWKRTIKHLKKEAVYFSADGTTRGSEVRSWPPSLQYLLSAAERSSKRKEDFSSLPLSSSSSSSSSSWSKMAVDGRWSLAAFGGLCAHLQRCLLDVDILSMRKLHLYPLPDAMRDGEHESKQEKEEGEATAQQDRRTDGKRKSQEQSADGNAHQLSERMREAAESAETTEETARETESARRRKGESDRQQEEEGEKIEAESARETESSLFGLPARNEGVLVLDGSSVVHLGLLHNSEEGGGRAGSLLHLLDHTVSPFGRRMFERWLLRPMTDRQSIEDRLDAVQELIEMSDVVQSMRRTLKALPDLERLLARIHSMGLRYRAEQHPDSKAILYELSVYNLRKIKDFTAACDGFREALEMVKGFPESTSLRSGVLKGLLTIRKPGESGQRRRGGLAVPRFPDMTEVLDHFQEAFDQNRARREGVVIPAPGVDPEYDEAVEQQKRVQAELEEYLNEQRTRLKCKSIQFWGNKKEERFQLEIPEDVAKRVPGEYEILSKKKGYKRFHTPAIKRLLSELIEAEERKGEAMNDQMRRIFQKFDQRYDDWADAVNCLAELDCLMNLALLATGGDFVRPQFVSPKDVGGPYIEIRDGRHPCVTETFNQHEFIPNDTVLGKMTNTGNIANAQRTHREASDGNGEEGHTEGGEHAEGRLLLLTGPNMGGKSTLLRQTCIITIMAQMGCYVPASFCRLTPVDRIFTRIGAADRIMKGQSTFFVELNETANILRNATEHSLVILDELGRGTSTFDGTAIAHAVIEHLSRTVGCRTLVATHYHSLVEEFRHRAEIQLGHMDCLVDPESKEQSVTFLYKLVAGACPKSYGINVARLARLPEEVVRRAQEKSSFFEECLQRAHRKAVLPTVVSAIDLSKEHTEEEEQARVINLWGSLSAAVERGEVDALVQMWRKLQV